MNQSSIKSQIKNKLKILNKKVQSNNKLPLSVIQYDENDIVNCLNTLTRGWPTIGKEVLKVENKIKSLLKIKNAIMVNSGGSANYLIFYLLVSLLFSFPFLFHSLFDSSNSSATTLTSSSYE